MSSSTAIEPTAGNGNVPAQTKRPATLKAWLNDPGFQAEIARALPRHCNPDRMARIAITALTRTPKLADCEHASFMKCLLDLSQWGLEPNGRDAHLIPFENRKRGVVECQLILDYKGMVQLVYRSGQVLSVHADVVYEGDKFRYSMGEVLEHVPYWLRTDPDKPISQGKMIAAYARVVLKGGACKCEAMPKDQIDGIRSRSKAANSGPWVTDYNEMAKKTVFRRTTKWLPVSAEVVEAFERDFDKPANFGASQIIDGDFVVPPSSLNQLADQRRAKQGDDAEFGEGDSDESEPANPSPPTLDSVFALIDAAESAKAVDEIMSRFVGPDAPEGAVFGTDDWTQIKLHCGERKEELKEHKTKGQGSLPGTE
jgi:recombination protein RecT